MRKKTDLSKNWKRVQLLILARWKGSATLDGTKSSEIWLRFRKISCNLWWTLCPQLFSLILTSSQDHMHFYTTVWFWLTSNLLSLYCTLVEALWNASHSSMNLRVIHLNFNLTFTRQLHSTSIELPKLCIIFVLLCCFPAFDFQTLLLLRFTFSQKHPGLHHLMNKQL